MKKTLIIIFILLLPHTVLAKLVGKSGQVYPINEISITALIEAKIQAMNPEEVESKIKKDLEKKILSYRPRNGVSGLEKAYVQNMHVVDMNHTLERDITSATGAILYPKGYTFNVLSLLKERGIHYPLKLVIVDGADKDEMTWFVKNFSHDRSYRLLITDGYASDIINSYNMPTYYATKEIIEKFSIVKTPSIVFQPKGKAFMAVLEVPVEKKRVNESTDSKNEQDNNSTIEIETKNSTGNVNHSTTEDQLKDIQMPEDFYELKKESDRQMQQDESIINKDVLIN